MDNLIDLHIHTNKSDGEFSPEEILYMAKEKNIKVISITDHDSLDAYNDEIFKLANKLNIQLITGVEISTKNEKCGIHVLAYNVDINNEKLKDMLYKIRNARHIYLYDVGKRLKEIGYEIDIDELDKIDVVTKAHISSHIVNETKNREKLIEEFGCVPERGTFIETIMNEGCIAYVSKYVPTLEEISEVIRNAGGKVVLAHPVAYSYTDGLSIDDVQNIIDRLKPDGIECYYILTTPENKKINEIEKWKELAIKNNLFMTLGSDFHRIKSECEISLGLIGEDIFILDDERIKIVESITLGE